MNIRTPGPIKLAQKVQMDPIIAYKAASVVDGEHGLRLRGVGTPLPYHPTDEARCYRYMGNSEAAHPAPDPVCGCGFYAVTKENAQVAWQDYVRSSLMLQVELYGQVIRHQKGYRASKQRVLGVQIAPKCGMCTWAEYMEAIDPENPVYRLAREVLGMMKLPEVRHQDVLLRSDGELHRQTDDTMAWSIVPICASCAVFMNYHKTYTPADLANAWGIEVTNLPLYGLLP